MDTNEVFAEIAYLRSQFSSDTDYAQPTHKQIGPVVRWMSKVFTDREQRLDALRVITGLYMISSTMQLTRHTIMTIRGEWRLSDETWDIKPEAYEFLGSLKTLLEEYYYAREIESDYRRWLVSHALVPDVQQADPEQPSGHARSVDHEGNGTEEPVPALDQP